MLDLDSVYREEGALVYKYLCTLCHDEQLAEELTQETFYQALRSCDRFDNSCKVSTWLCQIAKHLWYRELERQKKYADSLTEDVPAVDPSADEQIQGREPVIELFRRAHDLSTDAKEVFLLRIAGELGFREIGEIFGRSENWARVTYYRAKQKVTEGWDDHEV